jgi:hypothetical protein
LSVPSAPTDDSIRVSVFADGIARAALTDGDAGTGSGSGALGIRFAADTWSAAATISVTSSADTLSQRVGSSVLLPGSGASPSGSIEYRGPLGPELPLGILWYGGFSQAIWASATESARAGVLGVGGLYTHSIEGVADNERYAMLFEFGLAGRFIGGDVGSRESLRMDLLGTADRFFWGGEGAVQLVANRVTAALRAYWLRGDPVDGLTGFQMAFSLRIEGAITERMLARVNNNQASPPAQNGN